MPDLFLERLDRLRGVQDDPGETALIVLDFLLEVQPEGGAELREAIEGAAVVHWFDAAILAHLLDLPLSSAQAVWERLGSLPMVERFALRGVESKNVHETTRLALRKRMFENDLPRLRALSARARDSVGGETDAQSMIERLYHQFVAEPELAASECESLVTDWVSSGSPEARELLRARLEELERGEMLAGRARAEALLAIGWTRSLRGEESSLGDLTERTVEIARASDNPSTYARALCLRGDVYGSKGLLTTAAANAYAEAAEIFQSLWAREPDSVSTRLYLGQIQGRMANALLARGGLDGSLALHRKSIGLFRTIIEGEGANAGVRRDLAFAKLNAGDVLLAQGHVDQALDEMRGSERILEALAQQDPGNLSRQRDLSVVYSHVGDILLRTGDLDRADAIFQTGLVIIEGVVKVDGTNAIWQRDLAGYHSKISDVLILQRNAAGALESSLRSLEIITRLAQLDEGHMGRQVELAGANNKLGDVLVAQNRFGDAFAVHNRALRIYGQRVSLDPNNAELRRLSAATQLRIGSLLITEHRYEEAILYLRESLDSFEQLGRIDPDNALWQHELAVAFAKNSLLRFGRMQLGSAFSLMMKSLQIRRGLIAKDVANGHARNQLAVDLTNLAKLEKSRKNLHRARAAAEEAVEILQGLTQLHPDHVQWREDLKVARSVARDMGLKIVGEF